jgi:hypothetical protein
MHMFDPNVDLQPREQLKFRVGVNAGRASHDRAAGRRCDVEGVHESPDSPGRRKLRSLHTEREPVLRRPFEYPLMNYALVGDALSLTPDPTASVRQSTLQGLRYADAE